MIINLYQFVLYIHIFLGILWVGGVLFVGWGVFPASVKLPVQHQRSLLFHVMKKAHWKLALAGAGVIITGIILGVVVGPINSWDYLWHTPYGHKWLAALILGVITLLWGTTIGYKQAMKLLTDQTIWNMAEKGYKTVLYRSLFKVAAVSSVEGIGFAVLLYLMVL
ncbi:hypothetical protein ACLIA0_03465 [Bacillaceae bacterium W0354]